MSWYNIIGKATDAANIIEPVNLQEVKDDIGGLEGVNEYDETLMRIIKTCRKLIEARLGLKLVPASFVGYASLSTKHAGNPLERLPYAFNLVSIDNLVVTGIYSGNSDVVQVLDDDYYFDGLGLNILTAGSYKVQYDIDPGEIPNEIKEGIIMMVNYRFNNRADQLAAEQQGIPKDVLEMISSYIVPVL